MSTVTYPLTLPTSVLPVTQSWSIQRMAGVSESPFTGVQQTVEFDYAKWKATVSFPPMRRANASEFLIFLTKLHGRRGTFLMGDSDRRTPSNTIASGTTVTTTSNFAVNDIVLTITATDSGGNTVNPNFSKGDMIQIGSGAGSRLYMIVTDQGSGSSIQIEPKLKSSVAINTPIVFTNPKGLFRMDSNNQMWDTNAVSNYGISFSCSEAD